MIAKKKKAKNSPVKATKKAAKGRESQAEVNCEVRVVNLTDDQKRQFIKSLAKSLFEKGEPWPYGGEEATCETTSKPQGETPSLPNKPKDAGNYVNTAESREQTVARCHEAIWGLWDKVNKIHADDFDEIVKKFGFELAAEAQAEALVGAAATLLAMDLDRETALGSRPPRWLLNEKHKEIATSTCNKMTARLAGVRNLAKLEYPELFS